MNLWDKGKVLIAAVLLSVLYTSCEEEQNTIGFPSENNLDLNYFEYNIPVEMLWVDSVLSQNLGVVYTGKYNLNEAGVVQTIPFISFAPSRYDSNIAVPHNAIFKDVYLQLDYSTALSGEEDETFSLDIYQLAEPLRNNEEQPFFIEDESPLGEIIGQKSFTFMPDTLIGKITTDTVEYVEIIELNDSFGQYYLNRLRSKDSTTFYNYEAFNASFKGLALVPSASNTAILGFSPTASRIVLEYTYVDESGETKDGNFTFSPIRYYHNLTPNKLSPLVDAAFSDITCCYNEYDPSGEFVYQLFGSGINLSLDLSAFKDFADSLNTIIVNSASIEISNVESTTEDIVPPSAISFYFVDDEGVRIPGTYANMDFYSTLSVNEIYKDPTRLGNPVSAAYVPSKNQYTINVTLYMQKLIEENSAPSKLLMEHANLIPTQASGFSYLRRSSTIISGIKVPKQSIKLKIYYSTIK